MTTPDAPWPGRDDVLLPTRAFLLSVRDQTLPARRAALDDAVDHYTMARSSSDDAWRDMALLGVVGDALQIIEDVAVLGSAFERPRFPGRPVYVSLLAYSDRTATNFYGSIKNWPDPRLRVLASYNGRDPQTGVYVPVAEAAGLIEQYGARAAAAVEEARRATIAFLHPALLDLAAIWEAFKAHFLAWKHGGLAANREDFLIQADPGVAPRLSIAVWRRSPRRPDPYLQVDTSFEPDELVDEVRLAGELALQIAEFLLGSRIQWVEQGLVQRPGPGVERVRINLPLKFWYQPGDVSPESEAVLRDVLGVDLSPAQTPNLASARRSD